MMKLRNEHSVEAMSDKSIIEKVLGRNSVRLNGWGRDPVIASNTPGMTQNSKRPTYDELVDTIIKVNGRCEIMEQALIEKNIMPPPSIAGASQVDTSGASQGDTFECSANTVVLYFGGLKDDVSTVIFRMIDVLRTLSAAGSYLIHRLVFNDADIFERRGFLMLNLYMIAITGANNGTSWVVILKDNDINVLRSLSSRVSTFNHKS
ncbi:hypothetical protein QVD17_31054 [Tagetes erecta]|uniref:Uncharacterized protein n=1 Tax=Tagetes erecta TaxID=13708 RepID=A0AAD8NNT8_TARER|nr:hypothetical protein QVD17_31054 [Tagetes erecta]